MNTNKQARQTELVNLLMTEAFGRQEEVVAALQARGFEASQSVVSRDFRELGIVKFAGRYRVNGNPAKPGTSPARDVIRRVRAAGHNLLVIHTEPGAAGVVAAEVDRWNLPEVVGTIAGDDAVFIAVESKAGLTLIRSLVERTGTSIPT